MRYQFSKAVRDNDVLRASFNELTRQTFGFDFEDWYEAGHWGEWYIPHVLLDGDKVISNVSVNLMQFDVQGTKKNYIQLGTVMTHEAYRGQGLNRKIMERVLEEYAGKVDGIYLFGNDDVLEYYPKFGFRPSREYEYYLPCERQKNAGGAGKMSKSPYIIEKIDMTCPEQCETLYNAIRNCACASDIPEKDGLSERNPLSYDGNCPNFNNCNYPNPNDGMYMNENLSLYQFWIAAGFGEHVYYLPEIDVYIIAESEGEILRIHQIFGQEQVDMMRLVKSFEESQKESAEFFVETEKEPTESYGKTAKEPTGDFGDNIEELPRGFGSSIKELVLGYTPAHKEEFLVREHKEEDCTLFILGDDLQRVERDRLLFPVMSHA